MPVVATVGRRTPASLAAVIEPARCPADAIDRVRLLLNDPERRETLALAGEQYAKGCSWEAIAARHAAVYARFAPPLRRSPAS
jgi:hypothetical protein